MRFSNETILKIKTYLSGSLAPWWTRLVNIQEMLVCWVQERIVGGIQLEWCRFVEVSLPSPRSANQTKSRDMWQVICGGGRLGLDEYDIYCILKINKLCRYVCCNYV